MEAFPIKCNFGRYLARDVGVIMGGQVGENRKKKKKKIELVVNPSHCFGRDLGKISHEKQLGNF